jgi:hypothetical protein
MGMINQNWRNIVLFLAILPFAGCASIVDGTKQIVSVKTISTAQDVDGAQCSLKNSKGTFFVKTPGTVTVHRDYGALHVDCTKAGYQPGLTNVDSNTKGMAFGNLLFGGLIGTGVDVADGAAYDYPSSITVPMTPLPVNSATVAPAASSSGQPTS